MTRANNYTDMLYYLAAYACPGHTDTCVCEGSELDCRGRELRDMPEGIADERTITTL